MLECVSRWIKKSYGCKSCKPKKNRVLECISCQGWEVAEFLDEAVELLAEDIKESGAVDKRQSQKTQNLKSERSTRSRPTKEPKSECCNAGVKIWEEWDGYWHRCNKCKLTCKLASI